jgi:uncharacterized protein DUF3606
MSEISASNGKVDRKHVDLSTAVACLYWEAKLGAERGDIAHAIEAVGEAPDAVARWLSDAHKSHLRLSLVRPAATG